MTPGVGDVVDARYELLRELGGDRTGRVFVARDRPLAREVALRVVDAGDAAAVEALRGEARRMAAVQFDSAQAVPVLDEGETADGVAYVASELIAGLTLEQLARRRGPLPEAEAAKYAVELLDACLAVQRGARHRVAIVPGSAIVTNDGHVRVTRFVEVAPDAAGTEHPACAAVARILRRLLEGAEEPPVLGLAIDDALSGSITTVEGLRSRVGEAARGPTTPMIPVPPEPPARRVWLLVLISFAILAVIVFLVVGLPLLLTG
jgi:hypothetical protein